ncbi:uroporphyrinogen-III synthase [Actinomyces trachealis]|uniref:uroporphyrinogen-III synthase n=1 Tax=Actinomyces trachealis TaxID=2763540 RepID=UPI0018C513E7|nr:uroporphyrinogen-III synthase [Actinomyces trachealis]
MNGALSGCRVLLTRVRQNDALAQALRDAGAQVEAVALTRTVPGDITVRESAQALAASGEAAWLLLTSARTLECLDLSGLSSTTRVGVVGEATAQAAANALGHPVDLVAGGSAAAMLEAAELAELAEPTESCQGSRRLVLLPGSALSSPLLAEGLQARGWQVKVLPVYSTAPVAADALPEGLADRYQAGAFDVVVVTAGSGAWALSELLGLPPAGTVVATLGEPSARTARNLGLPAPPGAVARRPRPDALVAAVAAAHKHLGEQA